MTQIEAIYQGGVFKSLGAVGLAENQRVTLTV
jgi:predicted DNA-binding antitoxin AbrB/MazE fold protein